MGQQPGQGRGGLAPEQQTNVAFKVERQKVETRQGAIIGQFLIDGEQEKGQASKQLVEIVSAEEREATDSVTRDRIPRQYQKSVKSFFSTVQKALEGKKPAPAEGEPESDGESRPDGEAAGDGKPAAEGKPTGDGKSAGDGKPAAEGKPAGDGK
ncbi:MAG: hypothetical protein IT449_19110 [Phycisphaerales bacterium]|nr:hypothetical protein [Phycisphaerales bacterium]